MNTTVIRRQKQNMKKRKREREKHSKTKQKQDMRNIRKEKRQQSFKMIF